MVEKFDFLNSKQIELCDAFFNKTRSTEELIQDITNLGINCFTNSDEARPFTTILKELADKLLEKEMERQNGN